MIAENQPEVSEKGSFLEVLAVSGRLGLTSFGGPIAHLGYFREEYVNRRKWIDAQSYGDLVGLCQFLPGPASSQVGIAIGISRAGLWGGLAAWLGFTLPSAIILILFAYGTSFFGSSTSDSGWLHGLKVVAVAVVAQAVWSMARNFCPDRPRATLAIVAAIITLAWPLGFVQILIIVGAGIIGWQFLPVTIPENQARLHFGVSRRLAIGCLIVFFLLLVALPVLRSLTQSQPVAVVDSFYRSGALVFGGGHVVLPLLQAEVVPPGWVTNEQFISGYGAAQAVPGPLFTFSAFLGTASKIPPNGWVGGLLALVSIFLPAFLLIIGALPFWDTFRKRQDFQAALRGVNAAVVGILLAALYQPVWTSAVNGPKDFILVIADFGLLVLGKWPPWVVVVFSAVAAAVLGFFG